jgi:myo-inositol-1(or 4)-monophosphatase
MDRPADLLRTARAAAAAAAEVQRRWAGQVDPGAAVDKGHSDFVSRVDREAQEAAVAVIRNRHPEHGILAEEDREDGGREDGGAALSDPAVPLWIVDPLDGTTNYLHGHPMYAASVGVVVDGRPVAGSVLAPATGEEWWAAEGQGAWRNGERIRVSRVERLRLALLGTGFPFKRQEEAPVYAEQLVRVLPRSSGIRRGGSAAMDLCYLAQGILDAFWESWLAPWDVAAGLAVLAEAGGVWSRMDGSPLVVPEAGSVLAANGSVLLEELRVLLDGT